MISVIVDGGLHAFGAGVAIFVGVPEAEGDVFGSDFDEAGASFDEAAGEQATLAEAAFSVLGRDFGAFETEVESLGCGRGEEAVGVIETSGEALLLEAVAIFTKW